MRKCLLYLKKSSDNIIAASQNRGFEMKSLYDFIREKKATDPTSVPSTGSISEISKSLLQDAALPFASTEVAKLSDETAKLVNTDQFMDKLSEVVGTPKSGESEDEFVNRAKAAFRMVLRQQTK
jgi:hypothetical protein